jgi:hypothetical protein
MNKKGSVYLGIFLALIIYITGVLFMPFIVDDIDTARTDLDCSNSSISDGTKVTCLATDSVMPYFIWFFISLALAFVVGGFR